jgi:hypothetical protein
MLVIPSDGKGERRFSGFSASATGIITRFAEPEQQAARCELPRWQESVPLI